MGRITNQILGVITFDTIKSCIPPYKVLVKKSRKIFLIIFLLSQEIGCEINLNTPKAKVGLINHKILPWLKFTLKIHTFLSTLILKLNMKLSKAFFGYHTQTLPFVTLCQYSPHLQSRCLEQAIITIYV